MRRPKWVTQYATGSITKSKLEIRAIFQFNHNRIKAHISIKLDEQTLTRTLFLTERQLLIKPLFEEAFSGM